MCVTPSIENSRIGYKKGEVKDLANQRGDREVGTVRQYVDT